MTGRYRSASNQMVSLLKEMATCYDNLPERGATVMSEREIKPDQPIVGCFMAGTPIEAPMASVQIHGDQWCVFGNRSSANLVNDASVYSKLQVFGFPLSK